MADVDLRWLPEDGFPAFARAAERGFGLVASEEQIAAWRRVSELDRCLAGFAGDAIVATGGVESLQLTVPGGAQVPLAGVTAITVQPTHRRQGLLRRMMAQLLQQAREREEPLAGLWASESVIYGRFGFGWATSMAWLKVPTHQAVLCAPQDLAGRTRLIDPDQQWAQLVDIYDRVRRRTAGMLDRSEGRWRAEFEHDPPEEREGASPRFGVVYADRGYAIYRIARDWSEGLPNHTLRLLELVAADDEAYAGLWQFLLQVDLVRSIEAVGRPADETLPLLITDARQVRLRLTDALWLRLVDIPAALEARAYRGSGAVVLEVADAAEHGLPGGRWALEVTEGKGRCIPTDREAELRAPLASFGSVYLGGHTWARLARAGRASAPGGVLSRADGLFATATAPWCPFEF